MHSVRVILLIFMTLACMNGWSEIPTREAIGSAAKAKATHIPARQLAGYLAGREDFVLLDIRTEKEYLAGHIKGARWLPRGNLEFYIQEVTADPATRIVVYCRSGGRSALAAITLKDMGYSNVVDLDGGFREWLAQGNTFYNMHGEHRVVSYQKRE